MRNQPTKRFVNIGYRLTNFGRLVPDPNSGQITYSVDQWTKPTEGFVLFEDDDGKEYFIPEADIMKHLPISLDAKEEIL